VKNRYGESAANRQKAAFPLESSGSAIRRVEHQLSCNPARLKYRSAPIAVRSPLPADVPFAAGNEREDRLLVPKVGGHDLGPIPAGIRPDLARVRPRLVDQEVEFAIARQDGHPLARTQIVENVLRLGNWLRSSIIRIEGSATSG